MVSTDQDEPSLSTGGIINLIEFRIQNYRSINDSGSIRIGERTALVGRNESGKSNLLFALASLNPPGKRQSLSVKKDFPRDRPKSEFSEDLTVVDTIWELGPEEKVELERIFPRAKNVSKVTVSRRYKASPLVVGFVGLPQLNIDQELLQGHLTKLSQSVNGSLKGIEETTINTVKSARSSLHAGISATNVAPLTWAASVDDLIDTFTLSLESVGFAIPGLAAAQITLIREYATSIQNDDKSHSAARSWVTRQLPVFIYQSEYPELSGHQNIPEYLQRKQQGQVTESDVNFEKLAKVAELDPAELNALLDRSHEDRQLLTNRAGATVTRRLRNLWTDRPLKIRFALDGANFDTLISDPNAIYDVEVNLDERSRGLKWFFSFYVTFTADTTDGPAEDAILLLDEPGLYLHATAQRDLLEHFANDFRNQVVYTTHSPFMIPMNDLASVRTVNIDQDAGTTVTNDPTGDYRTLFPLQSAIGYDLTQTMFIGQYNLVVEGVTDFWYLSAMSDYQRESGRQSLPNDLVITPSGGAQKVSYMAALLAAQRLNVLVLLDDEKNARATAEELARSKLIRNDMIIFAGDGFQTQPTGGADIEDLVDPQVFTSLVNQSYAKELAAKPVTLNPNIPRIVKRYEDAFKSAGMEFHKTRPAKLFLQKMAQDPGPVTAFTQQNFQSLFTIVAQRFEILRQNPREPFR